MSKKLKLSPWHDGSVKPVHVGVYEVMTKGSTKDILYSFWDGQKFGFVTSGGEGMAYSFRNLTTYLESNDFVKWRGIIK